MSKEAGRQSGRLVAGIGWVEKEEEEEVAG